MLTFVSVASYAQKEPDEVVKQRADKLFRDEKYVEATPLYLNLLANSQKSHELQYKYGTCLLFNSYKKQDAFKYLAYAIQNPEIDVEAFYFLGKAYHLNYQFNEAIKYYQQYKSKVGSRPNSTFDVDRQIEMCQNGKRLLSNITQMVVLDKKEIDYEKFFRLYDLANIGGNILVAADFQSKIDKKKGYVPLIHLPEKTNKVFYASYGETDEGNKDIYVRTKLESGGWSEPKKVDGNVNTKYDEDFPYMHPGGQYLYFCSKGHNSMGGYDVFRSKYTKGTDSYGSPENMDFAISSPDNDLLYIVDSLDNNAYFASARQSTNGKLFVYKVNVDRLPLQVAVIKGTFSSTINPSNKKMLVTVFDYANGEKIGSFTTNDRGTYIITFPKGGKYNYEIKVDGSAETFKYLVNIPFQKEFKPLKQRISHENVNSFEAVKVFDLFDEAFTDDELAGIIADRAKIMSDLNPNAKDFDLNALNSGKDFQKIYQELGFPKNAAPSQILSAFETMQKIQSDEVKEKENFINGALTNSLEKLDIIEKLQTETKALVTRANAATSLDSKYDLLLEAQSKLNLAQDLQGDVNGLMQFADSVEKDLPQEKNTLQTLEKITEDVRKEVNANNQAGITDIIVANKTFIKTTKEEDRTNPIDKFIEQKLVKNDERKKLAGQESNYENSAAQLEKEIKLLESQLKEARKKDIPELQSKIESKTNEISMVKQEKERLTRKIVTITESEKKLDDKIAFLQNVVKVKDAKKVAPEQVKSKFTEVINKTNTSLTSYIEQQLSELKKDPAVQAIIAEREADPEVENKKQEHDQKIEAINASNDPPKNKVEQRLDVEQNFLNYVDSKLNAIDKELIIKPADPKLTRQRKTLEGYKKNTVAAIVEEKKDLEILAGNTNDEPARQARNIRLKFEQEEQEVKTNNGTPKQKAEQLLKVYKANLIKVEDGLAKNKQALLSNPADVALQKDQKGLTEIKAQLEEKIRKQQAIVNGEVAEDTEPDALVTELENKYKVALAKIEESDVKPTEKLKLKVKVEEDYVTTINTEITNADKLLQKDPDDSKAKNRKRALEEVKKGTQTRLTKLRNTVVTDDNSGSTKIQTGSAEKEAVDIVEKAKKLNADHKSVLKGIEQGQAKETDKLNAFVSEYTRYLGIVTGQLTENTTKLNQDPSNYALKTAENLNTQFKEETEAALRDVRSKLERLKGQVATNNDGLERADRSFEFLEKVNQLEADHNSVLKGIDQRREKETDKLNAVIQEHTRYIGVVVAQQNELTKRLSEAPTDMNLQTAKALLNSFKENSELGLKNAQTSLNILKNQGGGNNIVGGETKSSTINYVERAQKLDSDHNSVVKGIEQGQGTETDKLNALVQEHGRYLKVIKTQKDEINQKLSANESDDNLNEAIDLVNSFEERSKFDLENAQEKLRTIKNGVSQTSGLPKSTAEYLQRIQKLEADHNSVIKGIDQSQNKEVDKLNSTIGEHKRYIALIQTEAIEIEKQLKEKPTDANLKTAEGLVKSYLENSDAALKNAQSRLNEIVGNKGDRQTGNGSSNLNSTDYLERVQKLEADHNSVLKGIDQGQNKEVDKLNSTIGEHKRYIALIQTEANEIAKRLKDKPTDANLKTAEGLVKSYLENSGLALKNAQTRLNEIVGNKGDGKTGNGTSNLNSTDYLERVQKLEADHNSVLKGIDQGQNKEFDKLNSTIAEHKRYIALIQTELNEINKRLKDNPEDANLKTAESLIQSYLENSNEALRKAQIRLYEITNDKNNNKPDPAKAALADYLQRVQKLEADHNSVLKGIDQSQNKEVDKLNSAIGEHKRYISTMQTESNEIAKKIAEYPGDFNLKSAEALVKSYLENSTESLNVAQARLDEILGKGGVKTNPDGAKSTGKIDYLSRAQKLEADHISVLKGIEQGQGTETDKLVAIVGEYTRYVGVVGNQQTEVATKLKEDAADVSLKSSEALLTSYKLIAEQGLKDAKARLDRLKNQTNGKGQTRNDGSGQDLLSIAKRLEADHQSVLKGINQGQGTPTDKLNAKFAEYNRYLEILKANINDINIKLMFEPANATALTAQEESNQYKEKAELEFQQIKDELARLAPKSVGLSNKAKNYLSGIETKLNAELIAIDNANSNLEQRYSKRIAKEREQLQFLEDEIAANGALVKKDPTNVENLEIREGLVKIKRNLVSLMESDQLALVAALEGEDGENTPNDPGANGDYTSKSAAEIRALKQRLANEIGALETESTSELERQKAVVKKQDKFLIELADEDQKIKVDRIKYPESDRLDQAKTALNELKTSVEQDRDARKNRIEELNGVSKNYEPVVTTLRKQRDEKLERVKVQVDLTEREKTANYLVIEQGVLEDILQAKNKVQAAGKTASNEKALKELEVFKKEVEQSIEEKETQIAEFDDTPAYLVTEVEKLLLELEPEYYNLINGATGKTGMDRIKSRNAIDNGVINKIGRERNTNQLALRKKPTDQKLKTRAEALDALEERLRKQIEARGGTANATNAAEDKMELVSLTVAMERELKRIAPNYKNQIGQLEGRTDLKSTEQRTKLDIQVRDSAKYELNLVKSELKIKPKDKLLLERELGLNGIVDQFSSKIAAQQRSMEQMRGGVTNIAALAAQELKRLAPNYEKDMAAITGTTEASVLARNRIDQEVLDKLEIEMRFTKKQIQLKPDDKTWKDRDAAFTYLEDRFENQIKSRGKGEKAQPLETLDEKADRVLRQLVPTYDKDMLNAKKSTEQATLIEENKVDNLARAKVKIAQTNADNELKKDPNNAKQKESKKVLNYLQTKLENQVNDRNSRISGTTDTEEITAETLKQLLREIAPNYEKDMAAIKGETNAAKAQRTKLDQEVLKLLKQEKTRIEGILAKGPDKKLKFRLAATLKLTEQFNNQINKRNNGGNETAEDSSFDDKVNETLRKIVPTYDAQIRSAQSSDEKITLTNENSVDVKAKAKVKLAQSTNEAAIQAAPNNQELKQEKALLIAVQLKLDNQIQNRSQQLESFGKGSNIDITDVDTKRLLLELYPRYEKDISAIRGDNSEAISAKNKIDQKAKDLVQVEIERLERLPNINTDANEKFRLKTARKLQQQLNAQIQERKLNDVSLETMKKLLLELVPNYDKDMFAIQGTDIAAIEAKNKIDDDAILKVKKEEQKVSAKLKESPNNKTLAQRERVANRLLDYLELQIKDRSGEALNSASMDQLLLELVPNYRKEMAAVKGESVTANLQKNEIDERALTRINAEIERVESKLAASPDDRKLKLRDATAKQLVLKLNKQIAARTITDITEATLRQLLNELVPTYERDLANIQGENRSAYQARLDLDNNALTKVKQEAIRVDRQLQKNPTDKALKFRADILTRLETYLNDRITATNDAITNLPADVSFDEIVNRTLRQIVPTYDEEIRNAQKAGNPVDKLKAENGVDQSAKLKVKAAQETLQKAMANGNANPQQTERKKILDAIQKKLDDQIAKREVLAKDLANEKAVSASTMQELLNELSPTYKEDMKKAAKAETVSSFVRIKNNIDQKLVDAISNEIAKTETQLAANPTNDKATQRKLALSVLQVRIDKQMKNRENLLNTLKGEATIVRTAAKFELDALAPGYDATSAGLKSSSEKKTLQAKNEYDAKVEKTAIQTLEQIETALIEDPTSERNLMRNNGLTLLVFQLKDQQAARNKEIEKLTEGMLDGELLEVVAREVRPAYFPNKQNIEDLIEDGVEKSEALLKEEKAFLGDIKRELQKYEGRLTKNPADEATKAQVNRFKQAIAMQQEIVNDQEEALLFALKNAINVKQLLNSLVAGYVVPEIYKDRKDAELQQIVAKENLLTAAIERRILANEKLIEKAYDPRKKAENLLLQELKIEAEARKTALLNPLDKLAMEAILAELGADGKRLMLNKAKDVEDAKDIIDKLKKYDDQLTAKIVASKNGVVVNDVVVDRQKRQQKLVRKRVGVIEFDLETMMRTVKIDAGEGDKTDKTILETTQKENIIKRELEATTDDKQKKTLEKELEDVKVKKEEAVVKVAEKEVVKTTEKKEEVKQALTDNNPKNDLVASVIKTTEAITKKPVEEEPVGTQKEQVIEKTKQEERALQLLNITQDFIETEKIFLEDGIVVETLESIRAKKRKYSIEIGQLEAVKQTLRPDEVNNKKEVEEQERKIKTAVRRLEEMEAILVGEQKLEASSIEKGIEVNVGYDEEVKMASNTKYPDLIRIDFKIKDLQAELAQVIKDKKSVRLAFAKAKTPEERLALRKQLKQLIAREKELRKLLGLEEQALDAAIAGLGGDPLKWKNLLSRDVAPIRPVSVVETVVAPLLKGGFEIKQERDTVSKRSDKVIPIDTKMPNGLVYRVQVGAYAKPLPDNVFNEFSPVTGEKLKNGIVRYMAGYFDTRLKAGDAQRQIRNLGYGDAFLVAYCDGQRISLDQARRMEAAGLCVPQKQEEFIQQIVENTKASLTAKDTLRLSQAASNPTPKLTDYNKAPGAAPAQAVEEILGLFYTVQVGVYNKPVPAEQVKNISPLVTKRLENGQLRYSSGVYQSVENALPKKEEAVARGIKDAFITAYYKGERISLPEAERLLAEKGRNILETKGLTQNNPNALEDAKTFVNEQIQSQTQTAKLNKTAPVQIVSKEKYEEYPREVLDRYNTVGNFYYDENDKKVKSSKFENADEVPELYGIKDAIDTVQVKTKELKQLEELASGNQSKTIIAQFSKDKMSGEMADWLLRLTVPRQGNLSKRGYIIRLEDVPADLKDGIKERLLFYGAVDVKEE